MLHDSERINLTDTSRDSDITTTVGESHHHLAATHGDIEVARVSESPCAAGQRESKQGRRLISVTGDSNNVITSLDDIVIIVHLDVEVADVNALGIKQVVDPPSVQQVSDIGGDSQHGDLIGSEFVLVAVA